MTLHVRRGEAAALLLALVSACVGPSRVVFIDSSREPDGRTNDAQMRDGHVDHGPCTAPARIETYSSLSDRVIGELTFSSSRHAKVSCAKETSR